jgi:hypothetical protein
MKAVILVVAGCLLVTGLVAQQSGKILIKAGEDIGLKLAKEVYIFPDFTLGVVTSKDGSVSKGLLNFNLLNGEMQFIEPKGDTLSLADEQTIKLITIGKDSFYYDHVYLRLVASNPVVKLAIRERLKVVDKQRIGAYNQPSSSASIEAQNIYNSGAAIHRLNVKEDILMAKETLYYLGDKYNHFILANKKNLIKLFYRKQDEIEDFLRANRIDMTRLEDLVTLMGFLNKIEPGG